MKFLKTVFYYLIPMCLTFFCVQVTQAQSASEKHIKFGAINCEEELAILDNIDLKLKSYPFATAYFFVYGGKRDTKNNEIQLRGARIRRYLIENRGVEPNRVKNSRGWIS